MECPYCEAELKCIDYYGNSKHSEHYWIYPQSWIEREEDIYQCPNHEYFEDLEEAKRYQENHKDMEYLSPEGICCKSSIFNGLFYTDKDGGLYEGYPC